MVTSYNIKYDVITDRACRGSDHFDLVNQPYLALSNIYSYNVLCLLIPNVNETGFLDETTKISAYVPKSDLPSHSSVLSSLSHNWANSSNDTRI